MAAPAFGAIGAVAPNSSASGANIPVPAGVAADHIILAFMYLESVSAVTGPAGFTQAGNSPAAASNFWLRVFWKRATGADAGTYAFTGPSTWWAGYAARYTGCVTSGDPFDFTSSLGAAAGSTTTPIVSGTTTVADTLQVWSTAAFSSMTFTPPTSFNERVDLNNNIGFTIADLAKASIGATGNITGTAGLSTFTKASWLGALKPVGAAAADTTKFFRML